MTASQSAYMGIPEKNKTDLCSGLAKIMNRVLKSEAVGIGLHVNKNLRYLRPENKNMHLTRLVHMSFARSI